jgi:hypothetical protein
LSSGVRREGTQGEEKCKDGPFHAGFTPKKQWSDWLPDMLLRKSGLINPQQPLPRQAGSVVSHFIALGALQSGAICCLS